MSAVHVSRFAHVPDTDVLAMSGEESRREVKLREALSLSVEGGYPAMLNFPLLAEIWRSGAVNRLNELKETPLRLSTPDSALIIGPFYLRCYLQWSK